VCKVPDPSVPVKVSKPRQPPTRQPHRRSVKVLLPGIPGTAQPTLIRITQDGQAQGYWVHPAPSAWGMAYRLDKDGMLPGEDSGYDVLIENEQDASCTCPGHTYGGYRKHVDACGRSWERAGCRCPPWRTARPRASRCRSELDRRVPRVRCPRWASCGTLHEAPR
jgi:hypothetical protein